MRFEVCIDSVEGALAAQAGGAHRVELCADLVEGGVTPSLGMLQQVRQHSQLTLNIIIRPRGGDFCYTPAEFAVMQADILAAKAAGADGVVLGLLLPDGRVDAERTRALVALARPLSVTFHRAIDLCRDLDEALDTLIELHIDRVLTSGGCATALAGAETIARLVQRAGTRIQVMAGGGITAQNLPALLAATHVLEVHFSARETRISPMQHRVEGVSMGKAYHPDEYTRHETQVAQVRQVIQAAEAFFASQI